MLRDPLAVKKTLADHMWSKNICKTRKIWNHLTWQPLLARHVCVCVCVCVKVSVEERRCGVVPLKSPRKEHTYFSLYPQIRISLKCNKLNLKHVFCKLFPRNNNYNTHAIIMPILVPKVFQ